MSKKLLSEAQIRRFQGLANIKPLHEMDHAAKKDEPEMEEGVYKKEDDLEEAMHEEDPKEGVYKEEDYMEEEMEMDADDMDDDGDQVEVEEEVVQDARSGLKAFEALLDALEGGGAMMDDDDQDDDEEDKQPLPDAGADEPEEDEAAMLELALEGIDYQASKKEIVQEVAKRVARRLVEAKNAHAKLNKALGNK